MLVTEDEVRRSIVRVTEAFPRFSDWQYVNEVDDSYLGFCLWGEFVPEPSESMPRRFFITFDTYEANWAGHLTIGQHSYFWSSADAGDAYLVDTGWCETLEEAIATLRAAIADLFS